jgi:hypothetical protein
LETDSVIEMVNLVADITEVAADDGEASVGTISQRIGSKQSGEANKNRRISPLMPYQEMAKAGRFVPPRMSMPELSDDNDAFMPEVQTKPALKTKSRGVVRKSVGHDDQEPGQEEQTGTERMHTRGSVLVNKSVNLADDSQDADITLKQLGRGRGGGRGSAQGRRNSKAAPKKPRLGK